MRAAEFSMYTLILLLVKTFIPLEKSYTDEL